MVAGIREHAAPAVERLGIELPEVPEEIPMLHFREALEIAGAPADEPDLSPGARARAGRVGARPSTAATSSLVEGYPTANRAFYSHPDPEDPRWSQVVRPDLPGHRAGQRRAAAAPVRRLRRARSSSGGYPYAPYAAYVEAFRRGIPPHGGFAIGLERWVGRLVEAPNIREVTLFPRDLHRLAP